MTACLALAVRESRDGTLDALHLATAIPLDVDVLIAYDHQLVSAAQEAGLLVETPTPVT